MLILKIGSYAVMVEIGRMDLVIIHDDLCKAEQYKKRINFKKLFINKDGINLVRRDQRLVAQK